MWWLLSSLEKHPYTPGLERAAACAVDQVGVTACGLRRHPGSNGYIAKTETIFGVGVFNPVWNHTPDCRVAVGFHIDIFW
jgi:hypothetical protein